MHPTRAAHWHCPKCSQDFCPDCVVKQPSGTAGAHHLVRSCPKCLGETRWIGSSEVIKPFWERLPRIFLYPLRPGPVIYMAVLALGALIFWSWIVKFVCWVLLLNYAYVALKKTASGNLNPPGVDEMLAGNFIDVIIPVLKQAVLVFLLIVFGLFVLGALGGAAVLFYLLVILFLLPSMIIVLVNTESLKDALNPRAFLFLPVKIGKAYLILFVFLAILAGAPGALLHWFLPYIPPLFGAYLSALAENYYTVVSYHLMGYVLLQYHETIGYELEADDIRGGPAKTAETADPPAVREGKIAAVMCREGKFDQAIEHIRNWRQSGGEFNAELAEQYFRLLKTRKHNAGMRSHAPVYLEFAVSEGKKKEALEAFDICRKLEPDCAVRAPLMFQIGEWMAEAGRFRDALKVFSRLAKHHPDADEVPLSYFRAAQIYYDRLMDADKARKILQTLLKRFPDHAMTVRFENYLKHIGGA
jgi:tetratricopeptide (TPR) repeat protein